MLRSKLVLYAIDQSPLHTELCLISIASLRKHSSEIPVRVIHFGEIPAPKKRRFKALGVQLVERASVSSEHRFGLKWPALLDAQDFKQVLSLDADTYFFGAVEKLFQKYKKRDFVANIEFATSGDHQRGPFFIKRRIYPAKLRAIQKKFNLDAYPIFSSSIMLFNNFSHRRLAKRLPDFYSFFIDFHTRKIIYPSSLWFILEEICGSLILSLKPGLSFEHWSKQAVSHFHEWHFGEKKEIGTVMHYGSAHSLDFFNSFDLKSESRKILKANSLVKKRKYTFVSVNACPQDGSLLNPRN